MLLNLTIHNYALVETLELTFNKGMTVITGETGAGKSILLDALGLALGDRADSNSIRVGAERADIHATFDVTHHPEARAWLQEHELDNGTDCLLRRTITSDGRSRAFINGQPAPITDLRNLGEMLIDIHSQHEHQSLLKKDTHRRLLDEFSGTQTLAQTVRSTFNKLHQTKKYLHDVKHNQSESNARKDLLRYQAQELEQLHLGETEFADLEQEHQRLSQADLLISQAYRALEINSESDNNTLSALHHSLQSLQSIKHSAPQLDTAYHLIETARIQIEEAVHELQSFTQSFQSDPARLQVIDARLAAIYQLARKHKVKPTELYAFYMELMRELSALQGGEESVEQLEKELAQLLSLYQTHASELSAKRTAAAKKLSKQVTQHLTQLSMPDGKFTIALTPFAEPHINGLDDIEFLVTANAGQPVAALNKVASGGELSRVSLAIQVATAETSVIPTLVFDEVDVGIGGGTAEIVGRLLRQLGERGQIFCVTHLPQVAALGHHHGHVSKHSDGKKTHTEIAMLNQKEKINEIARMLGGVNVTKESLAHAKAMLAVS
jgi:DNA repair protein RecN (Recombination protein N)